MAANEALNALSTTDASNTPAGGDTIGSTLDDELRSIKANIARSAREESTATVSAAASLAVTTLNKVVPVSGSAGGSTTITLPAAATAGAGFRFTAWKTDAVNNVILDGNASETIDGAATYTLARQYEAAALVTDGTSWSVESTAKRAIQTADLADDAVTTAKIADDNVTLAKMEAATSGDIIYYDGSGDPARLAKGSDGQVLTLGSGLPSWATTTPGDSIPTGAVSSYLGTTAPSGWLLLNGDTIGSASSGATRASADNESLFTLIWNSFADAQAAVSSGRGASAAADWSANKTIALPDATGRTIFGKESSATRLTAAGSGVDGATMGDAGGAETHTLTETEMPSHNHSAGITSLNSSTVAGLNSLSAVTSGSSGSSSSAGGDGAHNNLPPALVLSWIVKV